jgi:hypothetical protein
MAQYQIIRDIGQTLLGVLRAELSAQKSKAKVHLATPTSDFLKKAGSALVLYLYDLRGSQHTLQGEHWQREEEVIDENGEAHVIVYERPLDLDLRYLLCATSDDLAEEHELLAIGMKAMLENQVLKGEPLVGDSWIDQDKLHVVHDQEFTLDTCHAIFGGFGAGPKVAIGYRTQARLASMRELSRSKRVRVRHIDVFDPLRPPPGSVSAKELGLEAKPPKLVSKK